MRGKNKWNSKCLESHLLRPVDLADRLAQSRAVRSSLGNRLDIRERFSRNPRLMRSPRRRIRSSWCRSHSVPSKSVSFSPYVLHRFERAAPRVRALNHQGNCCAVNKLKAELKRSSFSNKKKYFLDDRVEPERIIQPCLSNDSDPGNQEYYHGVQESPGPCDSSYQYAYSSNNHPHYSCYSEAGYTHRPMEPTPAQYLEYNRSGNRPASRDYFHSNGAISCTSYINPTKPGEPKWMPNTSTLCTPPRVNKWDNDAKFNFLMATYSEHNYPKSHPAKANYYSYSMNPSHSSLAIGNVSHNKSPSSAMTPTSPMRATIPSRIGDMSSVAFMPSSYRNFDNYHYGAEEAFRYKLNDGGNAFSNVDKFYSEAMRTIAYDAMVKKCVCKPYLGGEPQTSGPIFGPRSDFEMKARGRRSRLDDKTFLPKASKSRYENPNRYSYKRSGRHDFMDDSSYRVLSASASVSALSELSQKSLEAPRRSRSIDESYLSFKPNYSDNNKLYNTNSAISGIDSITGSQKNVFGWGNSYSVSNDIRPADMYRSSGLFNDTGKTGSYVKTISDDTWVNRMMMKTKLPDLFGYSKTPDFDTNFSRVNDTDSARLSERFVNPSFRTSTDFMRPHSRNNQTLPLDLPQMAADPLNKFQTSRQATDLTIFYTGRKDASLSPVAYGRGSDSTGRTISSHLKGSDLTPDHRYDRAHHQSHDRQYKLQKLIDKYSVATDGLSSAFDSDVRKGHSTTPIKYRSPSSDTRIPSSMGNTSGRMPQFQSSDPQVSNQPWKYNSYADTNQSHYSTNSSYGPGRDIAMAKSLGPWYLSDGAEMLSCLVEQETDRLKNLASTIQSQHLSQANNK